MTVEKDLISISKTFEGDKMHPEVEQTQQLVEWYQKIARPFFSKMLGEEKVSDFDRDVDRLSKGLRVPATELAACFLGPSGIGKSTLINAVVGGANAVVPSGGVGPLTAQAIVVRNHHEPGFDVEYHGPGRILRTVFGLEQMYKAELGTLAKPTMMQLELSDLDEDELPDVSAQVSKDVDSDEREDVIRLERREQLRRRSQLLITGSQDQERDLKYLLDSLREAAGGQRVWGTESDPSDAVRIAGIQRAVALAKENRTYALSASGRDLEFRTDLLNHATGYLAPLIKNLTLNWQSPLLASGVTLVDLPGVGVVRDIHKDVTRKWVREKAHALVLVVDHRGLTESLAEALRRSEFLSSLLYSADEPEDDPIVLVAITRMDDIAGERYRQDKSKRKFQHFQEAAEEAKDRLKQEIQRRLDEIWLQNTDATETRQQVVRNLVATLQVHPLSAPEYAKFIAGDADDPSFLRTIEQTGVPAFIASLERLAQDRKQKAIARLLEQRSLFRDRVITTLRLQQAQWEGETHAEEEVAKLKQELEVFIRPLREELANRQGAYRNFLKKTLPQRIKDLTKAAKATASRDVDRYLARLWQAHWATLRASVRRGGRYSGASDINLPTEFALRFEEPIAEVWGKEILKDLRKETKDYADDCVNLVEQVTEWALEQGARIQPKIVEAQRDAIRTDAKQLQAVGHEMVKEMRDEARAQLINVIEGPIKAACDKFVRENSDVGAGVKRRILGLYSELADTVTDAAEEPATKILLKLFKEVEKEILDAFANREDPLASVFNAIVTSQHTYLQRSDKQKKKRVLDELDVVLRNLPECEKAGLTA